MSQMDKYPWFKKARVMSFNILLPRRSLTMIITIGHAFSTGWKRSIDEYKEATSLI